MDNQEHVLQRMAEDIRLRELSPRTLESYTSYARAFLTFSHHPVAQLGAEEIRRFLSYLIAPSILKDGSLSTPTKSPILPRAASSAIAIVQSARRSRKNGGLRRGKRTC